MSNEVAFFCPNCKRTVEAEITVIAFELKKKQVLRTYTCTSEHCRQFIVVTYPYHSKWLLEIIAINKDSRH